MNLSISNDIVSSKIYHKWDDFNFEIVNFPFLDGDVPWLPSYGIYILQFIRFARVCSSVDDLINRNIILTAKLLKQGYGYHKIRKAPQIPRVNCKIQHWIKNPSATGRIRTYVLCRFSF